MSKLNRRKSLRYTRVWVLTRSRVFTYDCNRVARAYACVWECRNLKCFQIESGGAPHRHTDRKTDNNNIMTKVQHEQTRLTVGWLYSYVRVMSGHSLRDRNQKLPITIPIVCSSVLVFSIIAQCWWWVWQDDIMKTYSNYIRTPCAW